jgi:CRP-like cAMP-binding protein
MKGLRTLLAKSPYFGSLPASDLAHLSALGRVKTLREGELCRDPCMVIEGRLRLRSVTAQGEEFIYTDLGRGEFFGLAEILERTAPPVEAYAVGPLTLAVFSGPALRAFLDARPLIWRQFACLLHDRLTNTMLLARDVGVAPLQQRLARRLLWEAHAAGDVPATRGPMKVNVSQSDLARMLGTGRSVVNAMLKRLERAGTLTLGYRSVKLVDVAALRQIAGPDLALP